MKRLAVAPLVLFLFTCTAYKAQHTGTDMNNTHSEEAAKPLASSAVHPDFDAAPIALKQGIDREAWKTWDNLRAAMSS